MKYSIYINLIVWLSLLLVLGSCTEEQLSSMDHDVQPTITLHLPTIENVAINTRSISYENVVDELIVVLFREGKAKYQSFVHPVVNGSEISLTVTKFDIKSGETLYICCNSGITDVTADSMDAFVESLVYTNNGAGMVMWGSGTFNGTSLSVELNRVYAKASLTCQVAGITVEDWKICNVPSQGYIADSKTGYPISTIFTETINPVGNDVGNAAYFIPRTNNNSTSSTQDKTYLLVKLSGMGWYRLDFYTQNASKDATKDAEVLDIQRNTHYAFSITDVKSSGYATEEEAAANDGCNVVYDMDISTGHGASNGQYSLLLDREEILLYSVNNGGSNTLAVLNVSAYIPKPQNAISTYKARLISKNDQIKLIDDNGNEVEEVDFMKSGDHLVTDNSGRTLTMKYSGANVYGSYVEISLGNIVKKVPIVLQTSNCYLMDFATATNQALYIPIMRANQDGVVRINPDDVLQPCIVWTDQADVTESSLIMVYEQDKLRIKITNNVTFSGNVIVAVKLNGIIKWSWHIWSMDNTVLEYNNTLKVYDFNADHVNKFNEFIFMDRNLGAYTLAKDGRMSDCGLLYQFGRKDPFPGSEDGTVTEQTIYYEGSAFTISGGHPSLGACVVALNSTNNLEYSIQHPNQFIKGVYSGTDDGSVFSMDWFTNDYSLVNDYLWLSEAREKTAYNPCPIGWVTPYGGLVGPWYGLHISHATAGNNGLEIADAGYFPFGPYRNQAGNITFYSAEQSNTSLSLRWGNNNSSRISGTVFNNTSIVGSSDVPRSIGAHVRCVRENN